MFYVAYLFARFFARFIISCFFHLMFFSFYAFSFHGLFNSMIFHFGLFLFHAILISHYFHFVLSSFYVCLHFMLLSAPDLPKVPKGVACSSSPAYRNNSTPHILSPCL